MDRFGRVAASSSSGGIILKQNGRVGQVIIFIFILIIYFLLSLCIIGHLNNTKVLNIFYLKLFFSD